jgi:hypothetical protein
LGAAINDRQGGALAGMTQDMMMQRERAAKQAEALRMQAERMAQLRDAGVPENLAPLLDAEGARQYAVGKLKPQEPVQPRLEQDNAGNVWALDPMTGRPLSDRPVFVDPTERTTFINGAMVRMQNPFATPGINPDAPDTLPADFFGGGSGGNVGGGFRR